MRTLLPTVVLSPLDVRPAAASCRDLPVNELGAADFDSILRSLPEAEQQAEAIRGLLGDVATGRVIHPIVVRPDREDPDGRYELVSGWLVWSAALYLRKASVQALLWRGSDVEAAALGYRLNHHRVQMKRRESARVAAYVADLLEAESAAATYREVARALGCSQSWAFKLLHESPDDEWAEELLAETGRKRGRGRPRVARIFSFEIFDPRRWESSVRLRAVIQGEAAVRELRFQRSEEAEGWRDVSKEEFIESVITEIERLQDWLAAFGNSRDQHFSPGKIAAPFAPRVGLLNGNGRSKSAVRQPINGR